MAKMTYQQIVEQQDFLCPYVRTPMDNHKGICALGGCCVDWRMYRKCFNYHKAEIEGRVEKSKLEEKV